MDSNKSKALKVLSLFDGISCGRVALERAGIPIERYDAYEIDEYAIKVAQKNSSIIQHHGDVTTANFKDYAGYDLLIGGSPCQSLANCNMYLKDGEYGVNGTGASRLFWEYVRALKTMNPKYFFFENVASMRNADKAIITEQLGVEPVKINSLLFSAQVRNRLYWTNIPFDVPTERAAISHHRRKNPTTNNLDPITDYAKFCDNCNQHVLDLIKELNPKYFFIENPRGGMRKMAWMQDIPRYTVTYCKYGETRMKPTDIWTNHPMPMFKPACKNGDTCHVAAPRGSQTGTQGIKGSKDRSRIPRLLCEHIVDICEMRTCDICGKPMLDGFCIMDGSEYYCSDECLHKVYTEQEYQELYDNDQAYWTTWYDEFE